MTDNPTQNLECYLVGGVVRDQLLGLKSKDRDWVVVGATPAQMEARGFRPVGQDFPVFLHPQSGEEYALARTERKSGHGYRGFDVISDPGVTLEEDLRRRDLTINAMAQTVDGEIIDPYGGQQDLDKRILRHVSDAFAEDPVRVLRTARFGARFAKQGFHVHLSTMALMSQMVSSGEVDHLVAERVWQELQAAMETGHCSQFVLILRQCDALQSVLPEVNALFGVPQNTTYHPEVDAGLHVLLALDIASELTPDAEVIFAVLVHDLGKALTPKDEWPAHRQHEHRGLPLIDDLCDRLRVPNRFRRLALKVCENHLLFHQLATLKASTVVKLLERLDAFRSPAVVEQFALACQADIRGRSGREDDEVPQAQLLTRLAEAAATVSGREVSGQLSREGSPTGDRIQEELHRRRCEAIKAVQ